MNTEIKVHKYTSADDTELRRLEFEINSSKIVTPVKAISTKDFYEETRFPKDLSSISELFSRFNEDSLKKMSIDKKYSGEKHKEVRKNRSKSYNCPQFYITEFRNSGEFSKYPTETELEILISTAYSFSDITPIPCIPKIAREINMDNFDYFLEYLRKCYDKILIHNKKKIMGYIPALPQLFINSLIDFYIGLDTGVNAFYIDMDGTMITSHLDTITALKRRLAKHGYDENNFLHFINVDYGKPINDQKIVSARDLLAFGHGLDSLGGNHSGPKRNPGYYEWLKSKKDISTNSRRLLSIDDYGYYKWASLGTMVEDVYPKDALIPISATESACPSRLDKTIKIVNLQQQSKEAIRLQMLTNEDQKNTLSYFKSKRNVRREDIKLLGKEKS